MTETAHHSAISIMDRELYILRYDYNLAGQLKSITDPFTSTVTYTRDAAGRVQSVDASGYSYKIGNQSPQAIASFISEIKYRAWGAVKQTTYGNGVVDKTE